MRLKLDENLDTRLGPWLGSLGHDTQINHAAAESPEGKIWIVEPGRVRIWESWD